MVHCKADRIGTSFNCRMCLAFAPLLPGMPSPACTWGHYYGYVRCLASEGSARRTPWCAPASWCDCSFGTRAHGERKRGKLHTHLTLHVEIAKPPTYPGSMPFNPLSNVNSWCWRRVSLCVGYKIPVDSRGKTILVLLQDRNGGGLGGGLVVVCFVHTHLTLLHAIE